ncbi:MAG: hypothetical protein K0S65_3094 [Labilithrix sp.]|nr:hypothetical protein [Labilithrix sp.]
MTRPGLRNTNVEAVLNTLEHEKHARGALLVAFLEELREAVTDRAPESTRDLLALAERGEMGDAEFSTLLAEVRAVIRAVA